VQKRPALLRPERVVLMGVNVDLAHVAAYRWSLARVALDHHHRMATRPDAGGVKVCRIIALVVVVGGRLSDQALRKRRAVDPLVLGCAGDAAIGVSQNLGAKRLAVHARVGRWALEPPAILLVVTVLLMVG
jgi:hypothetical protein